MQIYKYNAIYNHLTNHEYYCKYIEFRIFANMCMHYIIFFKLLLSFNNKEYSVNYHTKEYEILYQICTDYQ